MVRVNEPYAYAALNIRGAIGLVSKKPLLETDLCLRPEIVVQTGQHDTLRIEVSVITDGHRQKFDFERSF